jgi:hypothetical protein
MIAIKLELLGDGSNLTILDWFFGLKSAPILLPLFVGIVGKIQFPGMCFHVVIPLHKAKHTTA